MLIQKCLYCGPFEIWLDLQERSMVAGLRSVEPVQFIWRGNRFDRVQSLFPWLRIKTSQPLRAYLPITLMLCNVPGYWSKCRNVDIVKVVRLWLRVHY